MQRYNIRSPRMQPSKLGLHKSDEYCVVRWLVAYPQLAVRNPAGLAFSPPFANRLGVVSVIHNSTLARHPTASRTLLYTGSYVQCQCYRVIAQDNEQK